MITTLPNQALQATAAAPGCFTFAFSHIAVVAGASALPAAVPELWTFGNKGSCMKTILITTITVVFVCGLATALSYLFGARGDALRTITIVTWGLSIPVAYTTAGISLLRRE